MTTSYTPQYSTGKRVLVPYVPTPEAIVERMLLLANTGPDDVVYDLGCGDGRVLTIAATKFGVRRAVGVEIRDDLVKLAKSRVRDLGLDGRVSIIHGDFFDIDVSEATVVTLFLLTTVNSMLKPKLERELRSGTRVISHEFEIPGWAPAKVDTCSDGYLRHRIYLYVR